MDLRREDEQICQWLEEDFEEVNEEGSDNSASETEDIVKEEVHRNTSSESDISREFDYETVCPSKRQRTQIVDSDESDESNNESIGSSRRERSQVIDPENSGESVNIPIPQNRNPSILHPRSRFLYGKNKNKWSSTPRAASVRNSRRNIVHFIPGLKVDARELDEPIDLIKLSDQLMEPWLRQRLQTVTLRRDIKVMIKDILGESSELEAPIPTVSDVRKICYLCPSKARRMTKHRCMKCKQAICGPHDVDICCRCIE